MTTVLNKDSFIIKLEWYWWGNWVAQSDICLWLGS